MSFKKSYSFNDRKNESAKIISKYPDRIPIICEKTKGKSDIPTVDKIKYLVPADLTVGQFVYVIRNRMKLTAEKAIFLFVADSTIPPTISLMNILYEQYKDPDGFLYITYSGENTFGMF